MTDQINVSSRIINCNLIFSKPVEVNILEKICIKFLENTAKEINEMQVSLVGHVKIFLEIDQKQYLYGSVTRSDEKPIINGSIEGSHRQCHFVYNAIILNIDKNLLDKIVDKVLSKLSMEYKFSYKPYISL